MRATIRVHLRSWHPTWQPMRRGSNTANLPHYNEINHNEDVGQYKKYQKKERQSQIIRQYVPYHYLAMIWLILSMKPYLSDGISICHYITEKYNSYRPEVRKRTS